MADRYSIFETALGFCAIAWNDRGISRFRLPSRTAEAAERALFGRLPQGEAGTPPADVAATIAAAKRYFEGGTVDFSDARIDLDEQNAFFKDIYAATRRIGWGSTTTYGALAKQLGTGPEAARDAGQAMAQNPVPLIIPCHRVLAAGGKPGGFSAPGGQATKLRMLELEGVRIEVQQSLDLFAPSSLKETRRK
jgi:methylated-DNA-[protein]-cysteine S-methyltransferase